MVSRIPSQLLKVRFPTVLSIGLLTIRNSSIQAIVFQIHREVHEDSGMEQQISMKIKIEFKFYQVNDVDSKFEKTVEVTAASLLKQLSLTF